MTDEAALLAAVAARPDDDTPRLAYADWCDDHGRRDRAEFVRVQCRLAALTPAADDYPELLDREAEQVARLKTFDPPPKPRPADPLRVGDYDYAEYARGFPATVSWFLRDNTGTEFRAGMTALEAHVAASPARSLDAVGLTADQAAELVRHPLAAGLRGLTLTIPAAGPSGRRRGAGATVAAAVAASPHLGGLRRLVLGGDLTDDDAAALAAADLPALSDLMLGLSVAAPRAVARLGGAAWFRNLRLLAVREHLGDAHLEALAALPPLPRLHTLDLADNRFEAFGLRALAASTAFPALAVLDLSRNPLGAEGAAELARAPWALRGLALQSGAVGDAGVRALLAGPLLDDIRVLELGNADVRSGGVAALAASQKLARVRHLGLAYARLNAEAFAALGASPHFRHLTRLDLGVFSPGESRVKGEAIAAFLANLDAPRLRHLDLTARAVGLAGAKALAGRAAFADLRVLEVQECRIGNQALAALAASPHLRRLVELDLWMNDLTDAAPLLDPAVFPELAACRLQNNPLPPTHAAELAARRGVQVDAS